MRNAFLCLLLALGISACDDPQDGLRNNRDIEPGEVRNDTVGDVMNELYDQQELPEYERKNNE